MLQTHVRPTKCTPYFGNTCLISFTRGDMFYLVRTTY